MEPCPDQLVEDRFRDVQRAARRWFPYEPEIHEEAVVLLIHIAREYVELEEPPVDFDSYLYARLLNSLRDLYRVKYGRNPVVRERRRRVASPVRVPFDHEYAEYHPVEPTQPYKQVEDRMWIAYLIGRMTDRERFIYAAQMAGWTIREIGESFGVSESRVSQLRTNFRTRMESR